MGPQRENCPTREPRPGRAARCLVTASLRAGASAFSEPVPPASAAATAVRATE